MIYLIRVTYYDNDTGEILDLLKIGYTKDLKSRMDSYLLHNPGYKLLGTREGETDLESFFHSYYSMYSYNDRREWFYYNQEIVDNFQTLEKGTYISKEEYIVKLREFIKKNISTPSQLRKKYMKSLLEEIKNTGIEKNQDFLYDEEFHISHTMEMWNGVYEKEMRFIDSYNFEELLKDLPNPINVDKNPWKNNAEFYYRTTADYRKMEEVDFKNIIERKKKETSNLLKAYSDSSDSSVKYSLARNYQFVAKNDNYRNDYVAVNRIINDVTGDIILKPVVNKLVLVNEMRAFRIQQLDYKDRVTVFTSVHNQLTPDDIVNREVSEFLRVYDSKKTKYEKLRLLCEYGLSVGAIGIVLGQISDSDEIKSIYTVLGPKRLRALGHNATNIKRALGIITFSDDILRQKIYSEFKKGEKYTLANLKTKLESVYLSINYESTPKANDIERWFNVKEISIYEKNSDGSRKRNKGYELLEPK